jgi:hypothetical protein
VRRPRPQRLRLREKITADLAIEIASDECPAGRLGQQRREHTRPLRAKYRRVEGG